MRAAGKTMADPKRFKLEGHDYYLKSPAEMRSLWADKHDLREACDNTLLIAERCEVCSTRRQPDAGLRRAAWGGRGELVRQGGRARAGAPLPGRNPPGEVRARADYEVEMILKMGFPGYFLVTADLIGWAKQQGIRVGPGRGSATGSLVSYAMGITDLDPLEHSLLFERFLNPDRVSMPDIDIDFDERRRGEVLRYVTEKYGDDRVAQVVTYGTIKTKQALKDASRVLGYPFAMGERITKALPPAVMAKDVPLDKIFDSSHERFTEGGEFRALVETDPEVNKVFETGEGSRGPQAAVGRARLRGDHVQRTAARPHPDHEARAGRRDHHAVRLPDLRDARPAEDGLPRAAEPHGHRRRDPNIKANRGETIAIEQLAARRRRTPTGCSPAATRSASSSSTAARCARCCARWPQPRSRTSPPSLRCTGPGRWPPTRTSTTPTARTTASRSMPIHPELAEPLAEILDETYGLVVYQEQVQAIARKVAGYTLGQADLLRRAMGKKKKAELDAQLENFTAGMQANGFASGDQRAVGHPAAVLRLRLQQVAHRRATGWCRTGRPTSRRTTPPSTWPRC